MQVVPKKDGFSQRKLLMCCSFNFLLSEVEPRSRLGMTGAGALARAPRPFVINRMPSRACLCLTG